MEIVSEPDLSSPFEAGEYIKKLRAILRYIGTCDGDMEKGSLRCDANISVRRPGAELGTRCEIKNVNSIRNVMRAIEFEAARQVELIESGGYVVQETRLFDADLGETRTMRLKEDSDDYRYFPDPDLLPLVLSEEIIVRVAQDLPELPDDKVFRYMNSLGLSEYDALLLAEEPKIADYFEKVASVVTPKIAANWICVELFAKLNKNNLKIEDSKVTPSMLADMIAMIENSTISGKIAKTVFEIMFERGTPPAQIIEEEGLSQLSDDKAILDIIEEVLTQNPSQLKEYSSGKDKLFGFFVGQVMKKTGGKASPALVNELLQRKLSAAL
jgi:aspartyl-tRNA(Asn)/glutamyl-tRNA(Gln) amidotransferase subunit B